MQESVHRLHDILSLNHIDLYIYNHSYNHILFSIYYLNYKLQKIKQINK